MNELLSQIPPEVLLQLMQEEPKEKTEITRGQFMTALNNLKSHHFNEWQEHQQLVDEAKAGIIECDLMCEGVLDLEDNGYQLTFYDSGGSITYTAKPKERIGFRHE